MAVLRGLILGLVGCGIALACSSPDRNFEGAGGAGSGGGGAKTVEAGTASLGGSGGSAAEVGGGGSGGSNPEAGAPATETGEAGAGGEPGLPPLPEACTETEFDDGAACQPLTVCADGEFEQSPPKPDQDRVCAPATQCKEGEYQKAPPSPGSDRLCSPLSVCGAGSAVATAPTASTDRACSACASGTFSGAINAASCTPWSACKSGQTESVPPSPTSDRICSSCGAGKYESKGQCVALTVCSASQYESTPATASTDRVCKALTVCQPGSRQTAAPTATTDRQCAACSSGTFSTAVNASSCLAWTKCGSTEFESLAPTAQRDRTCSSLTTCAAGTRIKTASTATSDRVCEACASGTFTASANTSACQAWSDCAAGFSAVAGSTTKDRTCTACASGTYSTTQNASSCKAWTKCSSEEKQTPGSSTTDAICCSTAPDRACSAQCPCSSAEGVCTATNQCVSGTTCVTGSGKKVGRSGNTCLAAHCNNDQKDSGETSVDCGGECGCRATFEVVSVTGVPSGATFSEFKGMSRDGTRLTVTLGRNRTPYPATIAASGALTELESYGKGGSADRASTDGNVVVGYLLCANPPTCSDTTTTVVQWSGSAAPKVLRTSGIARAVSSSGTVVAGDFYDSSANGQRGFLLNGGQSSIIADLQSVVGITPDGKYLVGTPLSGVQGALYNVQAKTITKLGSTSWSTHTISGVNGTDPAVIGFGWVNSTDTYTGYRWKGGVLKELGLLPGAKYTSPYALSADGSTVVGVSGTNDLQFAFIWTDAGGLRTVVDELTARGMELPVDLMLRGAGFISDDGKTIVGIVSNQPPSFWRVTLK